MYGDSFDLFAINIAANVIAALQHKAFFAAQCSFVCKYGTEKAAAYNEIIILLRILILLPIIKSRIYSSISFILLVFSVI